MKRCILPVAGFCRVYKLSSCFISLILMDNDSTLKVSFAVSPGDVVWVPFADPFPRAQLNRRFMRRVKIERREILSTLEAEHVDHYQHGMHKKPIRLDVHYFW